MNRLTNLFEIMLKFDADTYFYIGTILGAHGKPPESIIPLDVDLSNSATEWASVTGREYLEEIAVQFNQVERLCNDIQLRFSAQKAAELSKAIRAGFITTMRNVNAGYNELSSRINDELQTIRFFQLNSVEAALYENEAPFGEDVAMFFENENRDIIEAANCFATGMYTAAVFHLTRAIEQLTRRFGKKFRVLVKDTRGRPIAIKDAFWKDILNAVEAKIKQERNPTTGRLMPSKKKLLDQYEDVALRLEYIKNAWRNPVSHGVFFQPTEAQNVFELTRIFSQHLVKILAPAQS